MVFAIWAPALISTRCAIVRYVDNFPAVWRRDIFLSQAGHERLIFVCMLFSGGALCVDEQTGLANEGIRKLVSRIENQRKQGHYNQIIGNFSSNREGIDLNDFEYFT